MQEVKPKKGHCGMTNVDLKKLILDAESYFEDGQIGFVLDCCKAGTNDWNIQGFEKYLELYKMFLSENFCYMQILLAAKNY